jgi:PAS domain S-box-containing protein
MGDRDRASDESLSARLEQEEARAAALGVDAIGPPRQHLTDAMLDGFSLLDPTGIHIDVNPAFCKMTGFSREELIGTSPPHAYWPPEEYEAIAAVLSRTLAGENRTFPLTFMRKNGERFSALVSPAVIRDETGGVVSAFATIKDMGDLTPGEASPTEGEQLLRLTFDQAPIGTALVGTDFRFRRVNARFVRMTGYTTEELLERGFPDITHPDDVARDVTEVGRLAAGEIEEYAREKRYVRKDGSIAWGDVVVRPVLGGDGRPLAFVAMIADITARRRADEDLTELLAATRKEKDRLSALLSSIPDEIWFADTDGRFTIANPAAEREFGVASADEKPVRELAAELEVLRPDGTPRPADEAPPLRALAGEKVRNQEETIRTPAGGELRTRLVNATPILGDDGAIIGSVSVVRDITDLRRAEESLGRERERAQKYLDIAGVMLVAIAADQTVLFANRKTCEVLERDEAGVVGANWFDTAVPEAEREPVRETFAQLMADNIAPWEYVENSIVTGTGGERLIAWRNTVLRDDEGAIVATLSSGEDITERRRMEEALRESEDKFKYVFDHSADGKSLTLPSGQVNANEAFSRMLGYASEELAQRTWLELTHPDDVAETEAQIRRMTSGAAASVRFVKRYLKKDGSVLWADVSSSLRRDENGEPMYFMTTLLDITERKNYERLLAVPSQILQILTAPTSLRQAVDGIVAALKAATDFDAVGLRLQEGEDYPFIGAQGYTDEFLEAESTLAAHYPDGGLCRDADGNVSLECTCGLVVSGKTDPADPLFTPRGSAWTNDSQPSLHTPVEKDPRLNPRNRCIHVGFRSIALVPLRAGEEILGLLHFGDRRTDRFTPESIRFFEALGAAIGLALVSRRTQEQLRESEERYRTVADFTYDWEYWLAPDDRLVYMSPSCERITGYAPDDFLSDPGLLIEIVHPDDRERMSEHLIHRDDTALHRDDYRIVNRGGETRWIAHACQRVVDADGRPLGRRASNRDITARRRAEAEIRRLNAELRQRVVSRTEQLDAATCELEALAYAIAHDVRAPLRSIDGFSALVIEDERERLSPQGVDELRRVRQAAQTLARLLDELMGLSNVSRRKLVRQIVDLSALAREVGEETAAAAPPHAVELTVQPGLVAEADPALLRLILRELLGNAWKFTAPRKAAHVEVGARDDGGERAFFVRDDGVGFDMARAEHLFGIFQRLPTADGFEGDGIGLATVHRLVRRHGGRVWAEAEAGEGAAFFFTLPAPAVAAG